MSDLDTEIDGLLSKLTVIQQESGGRARAGGTEGVAVVGADGKADRFMELKAVMLDRLQTIRTLLEAVQQAERLGGENPKDILIQQNNIRENVRLLGDEWRELESVYKAEARKRKSKFSAAEMETRLNIVSQLQHEIAAVKDLQRAKYLTNYGGRGMAAMEDSSLFKGNSTSPIHRDRGVTKPAPQLEMTDAHKMQLQQIRDRDHQIDLTIEEIGKGVDELRDIAKLQNEEVKRQNVMLEGLEGKIDMVHERVINVNKNLKEKLDKLGGADKMCMNMICLIILLGLIAVIYKFIHG